MQLDTLKEEEGKKKALVLMILMHVCKEKLIFHTQNDAHVRQGAKSFLHRVDSDNNAFFLLLVLKTLWIRMLQTLLSVLIVRITFSFHPKVSFRQKSRYCCVFLFLSF